MTLGWLILLSFLHIAVCLFSPFVFFIIVFQLREFELSKHHSDICMALGGAYVISTIVSVIIVFNYYLANFWLMVIKALCGIFCIALLTP
ncbi:hypothetical protein CYQ91_24545 [Vibrio diabolicus]|uniref:Uncharacterized protein n=1 Tax=Vibrio diabolicus TaxID=50719 RepID=A0AAX1XFR0_9VIBR|nr:hypothetical protein [Vibrio diabolicus]RPB31178.1 hypothetical protein CYQ91_24545 [Vibrio diabolicus]